MARFSKGLAKLPSLASFVSSVSLASLAALTLVSTTGCSKNKEGATADGSDAEVFAPAALSSAPLAPQKPSSTCPKGACVAAVDMQTPVYEKASTASTKLGYLRMGAVVPRASELSPNGECPAPGGFVKLEPRGFVCVGKSATLDLEAPLVRASSVRPDLRKPLPYAYGFVRAVAPQYLRVPTKEMQIQSEMSLKEHMSTWRKKPPP